MSRTWKDTPWRVQAARSKNRVISHGLNCEEAEPRYNYNRIPVYVHLNGWYWTATALAYSSPPGSRFREYDFSIKVTVVLKDYDSTDLDSVYRLEAGNSRYKYLEYEGNVPTRQWRYIDALIKTGEQVEPRELFPCDVEQSTKKRTNCDWDAYEDIKWSTPSTKKKRADDLHRPLRHAEKSQLKGLRNEYNSTSEASDFDLKEPKRGSGWNNTWWWW